MRSTTLVSVALLLALGGCSSGGSSPDSAPSPTGSEGSGAAGSRSTPPAPPDLRGRLVFVRGPSGATSVYLAEADGSGSRELFGRGAQWPHWSPDGSTVSVFCCDDGMAAHFIDMKTGAFREIAPPDPSLEVHCGIWSADGRTVACESYGTKDDSLNGVYSLRVSDGRDLTRITSNPGGTDAPNAASPDGKALLVVRGDVDPKLVVARLGSSRVTEIPTPRLTLDYGFLVGAWSPDGRQILFTARADGHLDGLWIAHPDGSGLRRLDVSTCGGAISDPEAVTCRDPAWSPDGTHIAFSQVDSQGEGSDIYIADLAGRELYQVTDTGDASEPSWGPPAPGGGAGG